MADNNNNNNNNNGNPVVNPNNRGRNNNGLDNPDIKQIISINADRIIKAIKENSGNGSNHPSETDRQKTEMEKRISRLTSNMNKLSAKTEEATERRIKENEVIEKLNKIKNLSRRGTEEERKAAKRILDLKQTEIDAYEKRIEKEAQLDSEQETLNQKRKALERQKRYFERQRPNATDRDREAIEQRLYDITNELEQVSRQQKKNEEQRDELKADRAEDSAISKEIKDIESLITDATSDTSNIVKSADKIEEEQRQENRRKSKEEKKKEKEKAKRDKIEDAKDYRIAENLEDCFDEGLFGLAGNLDKTFKEATNNHINAMKGTLAGTIAGFVEKSFFSVMDYQTTKLTDAIGTLQSSFESTGMNISKAVLADRDEIASSWQNVTDELEERGYGEALNVTELFGLQEQMSKAGITDTSLQERVAVSSGIASALTGMAAPDFMSSEQLQKLNEIFEIEKRQNGEESALNKIDDLLQYFAGGLGNAVEQMGSGFSLAEGKSQELFSNYLDNITRYGIDAAKTTFASTLGTQASMGTWTGGLDIFNQMQQSLNDLYTKGISDNVLTQLSGISTTTKLTELIKSGNYEEAFKSMLTTLSEQGGEVRTEEQSIILDQVFGINADQFNSMLAGAGSLDKLFEDIDKIKEQTLLGTESEVYQQRSEKVKTGRIGNTKEQQDRNLALTDAVDLWATAEKSDIREADKLLINAINATNSGIQSAISLGIEKLINHFTGAGANAVGSLLSGSATGVSATGTASTLGATIGGKAIGLGPTIAAALGSFAASYGLGTFIDKQTGASEALSDWLVGGVTLSEAAITNLSDIQKENEDENNSYHSTVKDLLQRNVDISEATKNAIANKIDDVIDNVSEERNAKQNIGRTFKQQIEDNAISIGGSQFTSDLIKDIESTTGKSFSDVSETELADYYLKNEDKLSYTSMDTDRNKDLAMDMQLAKSNYKGSLGTSSYELADTVLSNYASAGYIAASDQGKVYDDLVSLALNMGLKDEERDKLFNAYSNRLTTTNENFYNYQAAKRVQQFIIEEQTKYKEQHKDEQDLNALSSGLEQIAKDIKSGTYEGLSDSLLSDIQKAQDYIDMSKWGIDTIADGLKITSENYYDKYSPDTVSKFATGLDYVPYDNFPALLHKGERVVTAADARLDDLANSVYLQQIYSSNFNKDNNNIEDLTTTNNSIEQGFNTTADNQSAIIAALQAIINILSNNQTSNMYRDMNNIFNDINTNSIALRANNIAKMASAH